MASFARALHGSLVFGHCQLGALSQGRRDGTEFEKREVVLQQPLLAFVASCSDVFASVSLQGCVACVDLQIPFRNASTCVNCSYTWICALFACDVAGAYRNRFSIIPLPFGPSLRSLLMQISDGSVCRGLRPDGMGLYKKSKEDVIVLLGKRYLSYSGSRSPIPSEQTPVSPLGRLEA
jgi:hypothetical protein